MNYCNKRFVERINIDFSKIDRKIYREEEINEIVEKYEVQSEMVDTYVSLENVYGTCNNCVKNYHFPEILDEYFDANGDGYHSRSVGMLDYDGKTAIENLSKSFKSEPIILIEVDVNKHLVLINGMHRFLVLRLLYLNEKSKCQTQEDLDKLKLKYTIPVKTKKVDLLKTYCKFLIDLYQPINCMNKYYDSIEEITLQNNEKYYKVSQIIDINKTEDFYLSEEEMSDYLNSYTNLSCQHDEKYNMTGKSVLKKFDGQELILSDNELIQYTKNIILNSKKDYNIFLNELVEKYESFKLFCESYFYNIIKFENREEKLYGRNSTK